MDNYDKLKGKYERTMKEFLEAARKFGLEECRTNKKQSGRVISTILSLLPIEKQTEALKLWHKELLNLDIPFDFFPVHFAKRMAPGAIVGLLTQVIDPPKNFHKDYDMEALGFTSSTDMYYMPPSSGIRYMILDPKGISSGKNEMCFSIFQENYHPFTYGTLVTISRGPYGPDKGNLKTTTALISHTKPLTAILQSDEFPHALDYLNGVYPTPQFVDEVVKMYEEEPSLK
ncbi:MAG: hypothetical protein ACE5FT_01720 [Candidatus Nanoarchaeia archaeon]